jgi:glutathione synthase
LEVDGHYAALRRLHSDDDLRSNLTAGGKMEKAEVDDAALRVAAIVAPRLIADGMFIVGLDIAGDKLLEINVFSPGGLNTCQRAEKVDFAQAIVAAIERKVEVAKHDPDVFDNRRLAVM